MNPIAIYTFGARLGPWLGRTAAANPGLIAKLTSALRVGGKFAGTKVAEIVTWAKSSPANAILVASTLASLGYAASDLFGESPDGDVKQFQMDLNSVAGKARAAIDSIGSKSEAAKFDTVTEERLVRDEVAIDVLSWARGFYGSVSAAVEAHRMHQAFVEMPLAEVRHGFSVYKLR